MEANSHCVARNNLLNLRPVAAEESGGGLPYAPENWPNPGDIWGWKTGKRVAVTGGYFLDRYLYLPTRLFRAEKPCSSRKLRHGFASKLSVERYIKENFPNIDLNVFFASFSWKIPALQSAITNCNAEPFPVLPLQQITPAEQSESDFFFDSVVCKAGNNKCKSLILEEVEKYSPALPCDICCSELGFCRDCSCILCCKTVSSAYGGYSYIKCQNKIGDKYICGHVAHMECALRARLAGAVGGSIGLDAEYYCRRCDGRTDLVSHVNKLLQTCKAFDLENEVEEKILNLGACLLGGSQKATAKELLSLIELAISKLKCGTGFEGIWEMEENLTTHSAGFSDNGCDGMDVTVNESPLDVRTETESFSYVPHSLKLEIEIDRVLQAFRKSQEFEYKMAEERLHAQKNYLQNLYQQLDTEKSELALQRLPSSSDALFHAIREREEQIRQEVMKFEDMKQVANGFSRISKDFLKEHFGLEIVD